QSGEPVEPVGTVGVLGGTEEHDEGADGDHVVDQVDDRPAGLRGHGQRREDDADAGDHLPGQDLPDPQGGGGGDRAPQGGDEGDHQQDPAPRGVEVEGGGPDADDRVQRDLGVQRGEQGHDAGGGAGVRAGQPAVDGHRAG